MQGSNRYWRPQSQTIDRAVAFTILTQGPGYTIARDDEAHSSVPYGPADRENGDRNHGFLELADRPDLAERVPEAQRSDGLMRLLKVVNAPGSRLLTLGCECGLFEREDAAPDEPDRYVGSYVAIAFRDPALNTPDRIYELTRAAIGRTKGSDRYHYNYEVTITPLRTFFGNADCYEMHTNALGYGTSDEDAWAAFGAACDALADAFEIVCALPGDDPLFS